MKRILQSLSMCIAFVLVLLFIHCGEDANSSALQEEAQPNYIIVDSTKIYVGDDFEIPNPEWDDITFTLKSISQDTTAELLTTDNQVDCYRKGVYWNVSTTSSSISSECIEDGGFTISGSLVKDSTDECFTLKYRVQTFWVDMENFEVIE